VTVLGGTRLGALLAALALIGCAGPATSPSAYVAESIQPSSSATQRPSTAGATATPDGSAPDEATPQAAIGEPATPEPSTVEPATPGPASPPPTPFGPVSTPLPPEAPTALPEPTLTTPKEIGTAFIDTRMHAQAVVSLLHVLGIGLYGSDGTPVRAGTELGNTDLFVYEEEARGMVQMLRDGLDFERWTSFRDFHAALEGLGFQGTAQQLARAYADAYDADPDAPMSELISSFGGVDIDVPISPLQRWLMFLDGFVKPNPEAGALIPAVARVPGSRGMAHGAGGHGSWGVAAEAVGKLSPVPLEADPLLIAHLMLVVSSSSLVVDTSAAKVHEGHGGSGAPVQVNATVRTVASTFVSPFSQRPLIPINGGGPQGIPVTWLPSPVMDRHGQGAPPGPSVTDVTGHTSFTYNPRAEKANGRGFPALDIATLQATVPASQLVTALYGVPSLGALVGGEVRGIGHLQVEWHAAEAMRIKLVEDYNVTLDFGIAGGSSKGRDVFEGVLALQEDGTWRGMAIGAAAGSWEGQALGHKCSDSWNAAQDVEVVGAAAPYALKGDFYFRFYPRTQPIGDMGSGGDCTPAPATYEGVDYAPYNDESIRSANTNQGLVITLPPKPGGSQDYPVLLPGVVDATWHVTIEYLQP
jgi:hypothetical protein